MPQTLTWKEAVRNIVQTLPREFSLRDVLAYHDELQHHFSNNRFIDAKMRQSLQMLRDQGMLRFVKPGRYERTDISPIFSPLVDFSVAAPFIGATQVARVALETWASFNLYCLDCASDALDPLPNNTPVADFKCFVCERTYQLKAKDGALRPAHHRRRLSADDRLHRPRRDARAHLRRVRQAVQHRRLRRRHSRPPNHG
jgi:hypothetical protein